MTKLQAAGELSPLLFSCYLTLEIAKINLVNFCIVNHILHHLLWSSNWVGSMCRETVVSVMPLIGTNFLLEMCLPAAGMLSTFKHPLL